MKSKIMVSGISIIVTMISINTFAWAQIPVTPVVDFIQAQEPSFGSEIIFHDDFESSVPFPQNYSEYDTHNGDLAITTSASFGGSSKSVCASWQQGQVDAGHFAYMFGRNPISSKSNSSSDYREIFWRMYVKTSKGWEGNPRKLTRATILANNNWAQAMIAHVWGENDNLLEIDPATGIDSSNRLVTTTYNDFAHLTWLGLKKGITPIYNTISSNTWYCIEIHVKLNTPGSSDGIFEYWIDGNLEARSSNLNWVGTWNGYGINAIMFENYWNEGSTKAQKRYMDNIVISTKPIGLALSTVNPIIYKSQFEDPDASDVQSSYEAQVSTTMDVSGLVWNGSLNGSSNQIQVTSNNGIFQGSLTGKNSLVFGKVYYARVRQRDITGNYSSWSNWKIFKTQSLTTDTTSPSAPQGVSVRILQ